MNETLNLNPILLVSAAIIGLVIMLILIIKFKIQAMISILIGLLVSLLSIIYQRDVMSG